MPGDLQPLAQNFAIVDENGFPTQYFIKWAQQRQIDITAGITAAQAQALIDDWAAGRTLTAGNGLTGGGTLAADRTFDVGPGTGIGVGANDVHLTDTAVTPATYGDATHVGQFTVDQQGRITAAANVSVSGGGGGGSTPSFVQVKSAIGASFAVTMGTAPTAGNLLVAICTHWNNLTGANTGWILIDNANGVSTDGYGTAWKVAFPGESTTQTPFTGGTGGQSTTIFEIANALLVAPMVRNFLKEVVASPMVVPLTAPRANNILIGMSAQGGSNAAFTVASTGPSITLDENITGTTGSNSPRRTQSFHSAVTTASQNCTITTTFTPGNMVGVSILISGTV